MSNLRRELDAQVTLTQTLMRRVEQLEAGGKQPPAAVAARTSVVPAADVSELRTQVANLRQDCARALRVDSRINEMQRELYLELDKVRLQAEHSAVRTGFLAVAASECGAEEKAWLFRKLKTREEALQANPVWAQVSESQKNLSDLGPSFKSQPHVPGASTAGASISIEDPQEWQIFLEKTSGVSLGITISGKDGKTLLVEGVKDQGLVAAWNERNPTKAVQANDRIVAINNVCGDQVGSIGLNDEATKSTTLTMTIRRLDIQCT
jgi:hypothetical protein